MHVYIFVKINLRGEYFHAMFRDEERVLELGGSGPVPGHDAPAVLAHFDGAIAVRQTRLQSEDHSGLHGAGVVVQDVDDVRRTVEEAPDPVAAQVGDDLEEAFLRVPTDHAPNLLEMLPGTTRTNSWK